MHLVTKITLLIGELQKLVHEMHYMAETYDTAPAIGDAVWAE
jgi:hypothetical protein